jgi:uncharacterized protein
MTLKSNQAGITLSVALFSGLLFLGIFIFKGLKLFSDKDRIVTVKGLAEMDMTAHTANIALNFSFSGDHLKELLEQTEQKKKAILKHLNQAGFNQEDISINNLGVTDRQAYFEIQWRNGQEVKVKIDRYTIGQSLEILSKEVETTEDVAAKLKLELVQKDLTSYINTHYRFPELNTIKPQLIAESTKNARVAGEQFANDSQAKLGKIKTASQGQITIAGKYYYGEDSGEKSKEPFVQRARVVSTIVFFLE